MSRSRRPSISEPAEAESVDPVKREEQGVVMVTVEDVTQQRVADEARNSFVAQATHELRTPLTNIRLYTEAMIEDSDNPEIRTKALNVISSESRRLERIVADMLSVSEIEAGTLKIEAPNHYRLQIVKMVIVCGVDKICKRLWNNEFNFVWS